LIISVTGFKGSYQMTQTDIWMKVTLGKHLQALRQFR